MLSAKRADGAGPQIVGQGLLLLQWQDRACPPRRCVGWPSNPQRQAGPIFFHILNFEALVYDTERDMLFQPL